MKKIFILIFAFLNIFIFAQNEPNNGKNNKEQKEYIISKMDDPFNFSLNFFRESINPFLVRFKNNNEANKNSDFVLAIKYITFKNNSDITLISEPNIEVPGIIKSISLWVDGRRTKTKLHAIIKDAGGATHYIPFKTEEDETSEINFLGWKKLKATVKEPPFLQKERRYNNALRDVEFMGIQIIPEYKKNNNPQYIYLSDLRASVEPAEESTTYNDNW